MSKNKFEIETSLSERIANIQQSMEETQKARKSEIIATVNVQTELEDLDVYRNLSAKDKLNYMYKVKPYFKDIADAIELSVKMTQIAKMLDVPYRALERMRMEIPELNELFHVAEVALAERVEANLEMLTETRVLWEEKQNPRTGDIEVIRRQVDPSIQAIKTVLEHNAHSKKKYQNEKIITHQASISPELEKLLRGLTTEELKELNNAVDDVIDAEFTEVE